MPNDPAERMQCMEIWGGNQSTDRLIRTTGLDIEIFSQPHRDAQKGGDVYYVSSCASGRISRLLLADCSGHGESVAGISDNLRQLMRSNINFIDQRRFVEAMNREFSTAANQGAFATALVGTYFLPTETLTISNAGHPIPLVFRAETSSWSLLTNMEDSQERSLPLGVDVDQEYSSTRIHLQTGDVVLCYTDGLTEQKRPDGSLLGISGLLEMVNGLGSMKPEEMIRGLIEATTSNNQQINADDDISMILFRRNDERVTLRNNLLAPFRLAASPLYNDASSAATN